MFSMKARLVADMLIRYVLQQTVNYDPLKGISYTPLQ